MLTNTSTRTFTHYHRGNHHDVNPATKGGFVLMGGSTDVDEAFQWMAERGGGGDFLILRGSGSDGYQDYVDEIADVNSVDTLVIHDREAASDPFVLEKIEKAEAIFMAGGDQWNYVGKWKNTPLLARLNQAILDGVPMGGTSAGLAVLGEHVFTAETNTITSDEALSNPFNEAITLESDFLQAPPLNGLITDTHFSERDRMGRLVTFMSRLQSDQKLDTVKGVGVDEKTAALVTPDGQCKVVGKGQAHFVQALTPPRTCKAGTPVDHQNLSLHSVGPEQTFDLRNWTSHDVKSRSMKVTQGKLRYSD